MIMLLTNMNPIHLLFFSGEATCTSVVITGAEGGISGTFTYDGSSYNRRGGSTSYILGKGNNDLWLLGEGFSMSAVGYNYPYYYVSVQ